MAGRKNKGKKKQKGLTPYQGDERSFGAYRCEDCSRTWMSAYSWANCAQKCKICSAKVYPHVQDEDSEPIRAGVLKSYLSRRTGSGYTHQSEPTKRGEYYIEVRISNFRELEAIPSADRWQHSLINFKSAVDEKTPTWKAVTQLVSCIKEDYRNVRPILYPTKR